MNRPVGGYGETGGPRSESESGRTNQRMSRGQVGTGMEREWDVEWDAVTDLEAELGNERAYIELVA